MKTTNYEFLGFRGSVKGCTYYGTEDDLKECMDLPKSWKKVKEVTQEEVDNFRNQAMEMLGL